MEASDTYRASVRDFLNVIFKRRFQILLFFVITLATVVTFTFLVKPVYEASARILVKTGRENIYVPTSGSGILEISINREEQINSEIEILKSKSLAKEVVSVLGATSIYPKLAGQGRGILAFILPMDNDQHTTAAKARMSLHKKLGIHAIKKSNVINVSFKHNDPQMAAKVVNTLANLYLTKFEETHIPDASESQKIDRVILIEPAQVPLNPISPKVFLNLALGLLVGVLGGLGLVFVLHLLDDSLESVEDVEGALDVPVLISIPYDKKEIS